MRTALAAVQNLIIDPYEESGLTQAKDLLMSYRGQAIRLEQTRAAGAPRQPTPREAPGKWEEGVPSFNPALLSPRETAEHAGCAVEQEEGDERHSLLNSSPPRSFQAPVPFKSSKKVRANQALPPSHLLLLLLLL